MQSRVKTGNEKRLREVMTAMGATHILAAYDGGGDEGFFDSIDFLRADNSRIDTSETMVSGVLRAETDYLAEGMPLKAEVVDMSLRELAEDILMEALNGRHKGWENNDGSSGTMRMDLSGAVSIDHSPYPFEADAPDDPDL